MQNFCFCQLSMQILWRRRCSRVVDLKLPIILANKNQTEIGKVVKEATAVYMPNYITIIHRKVSKARKILLYTLNTGNKNKSNAQSLNQVTERKKHLFHLKDHMYAPLYISI